MAKQKELTQLKKGTAEFTLIGEAKINDYTFGMDLESQNSDWIYNRLNLGVICGENGTIYAEMMGGYGSEREQNYIYNVHGKKEYLKNGEAVKDQKGNPMMIDDYSSVYNIDWDDRFDKEILESIGDNCFLTVGLEKDENDKIVYKKFLSEYDATSYIQEHLENEMVVKVKGNLAYSIYNEKVQMKKNITSIILSKAKPEQYKASFTQMLLIDKNSVGKVDKETLTIPIYAKVLDYVKNYENKLVKKTLPLSKTFNIKVSKEELEKIKKFLKLFKAKAGKISTFTVDGIFSRGEVETVEVSEKDIPEDIRELIEAGYIDKEEILNKIALSNGGGKQKPEQMIITSPHIKMVGDDIKIPQIQRELDVYTEDDIDINLITSNCKELDNVEKDLDDLNNDTDNSDSDLDKVMNEESNESENEEDEDDWLNQL